MEVKRQKFGRFDYICCRRFAAQFAWCAQNLNFVYLFFSFQIYCCISFEVRDVNVTRTRIGQTTNQRVIRPWETAEQQQVEEVQRNSCISIECHRSSGSSLSLWIVYTIFNVRLSDQLECEKLSFNFKLSYVCLSLIPILSFALSPAVHWKRKKICFAIERHAFP